MALNPTGIMSIGGPVVGSSINLELGLSATANSSLNQANFRTLAGIPSGVIALSNFYGKSNGLQRGMITFVAFTAFQNFISSVGVIASDTSCNGPGRIGLASTPYGGDKGIIGYGIPTPNAVTNISNLVSNTGVIAASSPGVGTARGGISACGYGGDKGMFIGGQRYPNLPTSTGIYAITNLVSNTGAVAADTPMIGPARWGAGAASYGGDKGILGYGMISNPATRTTGFQLISNTGVIAAVGQSIGTPRYQSTAAPYGGDKAIFCYGDAVGAPITSMANTVSNTGVVSSDIPTASGASRRRGACGYGGDKGIFAYGNAPTPTAGLFSNLVSNTGIIAANTPGVGTARVDSSGLSFSFTP